MRWRTTHSCVHPSDVAKKTRSFSCTIWLSLTKPPNVTSHQLYLSVPRLLTYAKASGMHVGSSSAGGWIPRMG